MSINRNFVSNIDPLMEQIHLREASREIRENFKLRLKEYYLTNKSLGQFKENEKFSTKDLFLVAKSLNWKGKEIQSLLRYFWGTNITLQDLNQVLTEQGFFE